MSEVIDEKVVKMRFDNQQFENGVKDTIRSLNDLKENLKFENAVKGLQTFSDEMAYTNTNGIDEMTKKTSKLSDIFNEFIKNVAIGGVRKLGEEITTNILGQLTKIPSVIKELTTGQMAPGYQKYNDKTTAVSTIVSQGYALEEVNEQLERLNWFSDETSYSFTDMVSNIGKFTATGQKLDESVTAMEGIATWAALSGQNATTASRAMYNVAQAMSAGTMKMQDWKSIQIASMDTSEFRDKAIEAAIAVGQLTEAGEGLYKFGGKTYTKNSLFGEGLSKGWFDSKTMMKVFNEYSGAVNEIYEYAEEHNITASEAMEELGDSLDSFGVKAFKAAQEARTFTDVIDSVKDAVSTSWMTTYEYVIGNQAEAIKLFTVMANELYELFNSSGLKRNAMLEEWKELGGRKALLNSIVNILQNIRNVVIPIKDAFSDLFSIPDSAQKLFDFTSKLEELTEKLIINKDTMVKIKVIALGIMSPFKLILEIVKEFIMQLTGSEKTTNKFGNSLLDFITRISYFVYKLNEYLLQSGAVQKYVKSLFTIIKAILKPLQTFFKIMKEFKIGEKIAYVILFIANSVNNLLKFIYHLISGISELLSNTDKLKMFLNYICQLFSLAGMNIIQGFKLGISSGIKTILATVVNLCTSIITTACKVLGIHSPSTVFYAIGVFIFQGLYNGLKWGMKNLNAIKDLILSIVNSIVNIIKDGIDWIKDNIDWITSSRVFSLISTIFEQIFDESSRFRVVLSKMGNSLLDFCESLDFTRIRTIAFTISILGILGAIKNLLNTTAGLVSSFSNVGKSISGFFNAGAGLFRSLTKPTAKKSFVKSFAEVIAILVVALTALALLNKYYHDDLIEAGNVLAAVMAGLFAFTAGLALIFGLLNKFSSIDKLNELLESLGKCILKMGIVVMELAVASYLLTLAVEKMSQITRLKRALAGVAITLAMLTGVVAALSVLSAKLGAGSAIFQKGSIMLVSYAISIMLLANAFKAIDGLNNIYNDMEAVFAMLIGLAAVAYAMKGVGFGAAAALGVMGLMLYELAFVMNQVEAVFMAGTNTEKILMIIKIVVFLGVLAGSIIAGVKIIKKLQGVSTAYNEFGIGMLSIAGSLLMVAIAMNLVKTIAPEDAIKAGFIMLGIIVLVTIFGSLYSVLQRVSYGNAPKLAMAFGLLTLTMTLLIANMALLTFIEWPEIWKGIFILASISIMFGMLEGLSYFTKDVKMGAIISLMIAITIMFGELVLLSQLPFTEVLTASGSFAIVLGALGAIFEQLANMAKEFKDSKGILRVIILIDALVAIISYALFALASIDTNNLSEKLLSAGFSIFGVLMGIVIVFNQLKEIPATYNADTFYQILTIILLLVVIAGAIGLISSYGKDWESIVAASVAIAIVFATLIPVMKQLQSTSMDLNTMGSLLAVCAVLVTLAYSLAILAQFNWDQLWAPMVTLVGGLLLLSAVIAILGKVASNGEVILGLIAIFAVLAAMTVSILVISIAIGVLADSLMKFSQVNISTILEIALELMILGAAISFIGILLPAFIAATASMAFMIVIFMAASTAVMIFSIALGALALPLAQIASLNLMEIASGMLAFSGACISMVAAIAGLALASILLKVFGNTIENEFSNSFRALHSAAVESIIDAAKSISTTVIDTREAVYTAGKFMGEVFVLGYREGLDWHSPPPWSIDSMNDSVFAMIDTVGKNKGNLFNLGSAFGNLFVSGYQSVGVAEEPAKDIYKGFEEQRKAIADLEAEGQADFSEYQKAFDESMKDTSEEGLKHSAELLAGWYNTGKVTESFVVSQYASIEKLGSKSYKTFCKAQQNALDEFSKKEKAYYKQQNSLGNKLTNIYDQAAGYVKENAGTIELTDFFSVDTSMLNAKFDSAFDSSSWSKQLNGYDVEREADSNLIKELEKVYGGTTGKHGLRFNEEMMRRGFQYKNGKWVKKEHVKGLLETDEFEITDLGDGLEDLSNGLGDADSSAKSLNETLEDSISIFEEFSDATDLTTSKLLSNMESQINGMETWAANLASIKGTIDEELYKELVNKGTGGYKEVNAILGMNQAQRDYMSRTYKKKTEASEKAAKLLNGEIQNESKTLMNNKKAIASASDSLEGYTKTTEEVSKANIQSMYTLSKYSLEISKAGADSDLTTEKVMAMANEIMKSNPAIAKMGLTTEDVTDALMEMANGMSEVKESIKKSVKDSIDIFKKWDDEYEMTSEQILENMHSQVQGITKWSGQLADLAARGIDSSLLAYLQSLGPQGAEYVNAFYNMTAEELADAGSTYAHAMELGDEVSDQLVDQYAETGYFLTEGFADGILNGKNASDNAVNMIGQSALDTLMTVLDEHSPSKQTYMIGEFFVEGFVDSLRDKAPSLLERVRTIGAEAIQGIKDTFNPTSIRETVNNLSNTLTSGLSKVSLAAAIANAGEETKKGFEDTYKGVSRIIDWDDLNPVIKPTLDISDVTNGFRQINELFNQQKSMSVNGSGSNGANQNGGNIVFNQYNSSPKSLNNSEIYRQTNNLVGNISRAGTTMTSFALAR